MIPLTSSCNLDDLASFRQWDGDQVRTNGVVLVHCDAGVADGRHRIDFTIPLAAISARMSWSDGKHVSLHLLSVL